MLVLTRTRSKNSAMEIGNAITVSVVEWSDKYRVVKLAFLTKEPLVIRREEVDKQAVYPARMGNLVLSRRKGEAVLIGDTIRITVLEITPMRCSIGIEAPREVLIARVEAKSINIEEVYEL